MLYRIVRPLAKIALRLTYRKIYFTHPENIPKDKPVILAVNHPTIFLEPCLLACFLPMPLYFLARGNLFNKLIFRKMLNSLHLIPIFRLKDGGYKKLKNNFSTFDYCYQALSEQKVILIMAEGNCVQEKRLRSIKKGTARLAFGTFEKHGDLDIHIVPVGVNYTYPDDWRSEVMFEFGEPIKVSDYQKNYEEDPNDAIRKISTTLRKRLEDIVIIIDKKEDEMLTEQLFVIDRNNSLEAIFPVLSSDNRRLQSEIRIARQINQMPEEEKMKWKARANEYFQKIEANKLSDFAVAHPDYYTFDRSIILIIGFIPFLIGYLFNYLPIVLAEQVGKPIKDIEDRFAIVVSASIVTFLLYYIALIILGLTLSNIWYWVFMLMLPIWGYFSLLYRELYTKWKAAKQFSKLEDSLTEQFKAERSVLSKL